MQITTLGIDMAKHVFQLHGVDKHGHVVLTKRLSRAKVLPFMAQYRHASLAWKPPAAPITGLES
jgi:transposase